MKKFRRSTGTILLSIFSLFMLNTPAWADCTLTNAGMIPIPELGLKLYQGFSGGLYPNGANNRPPAHLAAGMQIATNQIKPLNATGNVDTNSGKIVLLSIGMSNTTQEWASKGTNTFSNLVARDLGKNPQLAVVDGAQGGQDTVAWTNINAATWSTVLSRLARAGVTTNQVQAIWMKEARANGNGAFPGIAQSLQGEFEMIVRNAKALYPHLQIIYVSSRTRAYVATSGLNPNQPPTNRASPSNG